MLDLRILSLTLIASSACISGLAIERRQVALPCVVGDLSVAGVACSSLVPAVAVSVFTGGASTIGAGVHVEGSVVTDGSVSLTGFELSATSDYSATSPYVSGGVIAGTLASSDAAQAVLASLGNQNLLVTLDGEVGPASMSIPGYYKWTTALSIDFDLALTGDNTAVYIFETTQVLPLMKELHGLTPSGCFHSEALSIAASITFDLGAVNPASVFWIVGGATTVGASSCVQGVFVTKAATNFGASTTFRGQVIALDTFTAGAGDLFFAATADGTCQNRFSPAATPTVPLTGSSTSAATDSIPLPMANPPSSPLPALGAAGDFSVIVVGAATLGADATIGGKVYCASGTVTGFENVDYSPADDSANALAAAVAALDFSTSAITVTATDLNAGELGGLNLTSGYYHWNAAISVTTDLTLTGSATDVFILETPAALTMAASVNVILAGVDPSNVLWRVRAAATFGASSNMQGNLVVGAATSFGASTTFVGKILALDAFTAGAGSTFSN